MDIKVTTTAGGIFIILNASAFGMDAVIGHTENDPKPRIFNIGVHDKLEKI